MMDLSAANKTKWRSPSHQRNDRKWYMIQLVIRAMQEDLVQKLAQLRPWWIPDQADSALITESEYSTVSSLWNFSL
jgi:hypothetical protein